MSETMLFPRCVQVCVVVPLLRILLFSFSLCVFLCVCTALMRSLLRWKVGSGGDTSILPERHEYELTTK